MHGRRPTGSLPTSWNPRLGQGFRENPLRDAEGWTRMRSGTSLCFGGYGFRRTRIT